MLQESERQGAPADTGTASQPARPGAAPLITTLFGLAWAPLGGWLAACLAALYLAWKHDAGPVALLLLAAVAAVGARLAAKLAHAIRGHLRGIVAAAEQNASLVAQLRRSLRAQQEAHSARSRFLGAASHDLRQPVQALLFLSDIFRKSTDAARRDAMAQQIVRTSESIDGMFRHLVDFAQIDAGTMKAVVQPVQIDRLVGAAVSGFAEKCAARGLRFRMELEPGCTVAADPVLLERLLRNFLDNAWKYSLQGEIALRVERHRGHAVVSVTDQGVGMEPEDLEQAANAFFRGRSASVAEAEGIGLGLAVCKHIAELMRSELHLISRAGRGTRVSVRLPLVEPGHPAAGAHESEPGEAPLRGWLVAVLENDRLAREALCAWLQEAGARVVDAGSLERLREQLRERKETPSFVLADFRLGEGSGAQAIAALQADHGELPALVLSGEADLLERDLPWPVLQKPVTPDRLLEALRAAAPQCTGGGVASSSRMLTPARAST